MKAIKTLWLGLALSGLLGVTVSADTNDAWLTTKSKIALLTADGVSVLDVNVDTVNGSVTLHGKVKTESEKSKAAAAVRGVDGVKSVNNLLQVVPDAFKESVKASDAAIKDRVQAALKADSSISGISVASVNNGVVLLSGKADSLTEKLRAIELAWTAAGVARVASEIEVAAK
jgi:hyperosmotically inducible periplasmic protein